MKIKSLQINVLALLFGFATICFVNKIDAGNATRLSDGQQFFADNGKDFSKKNPKVNPKRGGAATTLNWTFRGPDDKMGIVTSVVSVSNTSIMYVGAAHNGVWKSTDGGNTAWTKMSVEPNQNLYVTCLALDEASNVLYAGTGGDFMGQGVYKSEAGGALKLMAGSENWANVYKIAVFGNKVYAATNAGLWCHTDGSWKICTGTRDGNPVTLDGPVRDLSVNKAGLVIAAVNRAECYISKSGAFNGFEYNDLTGDMNIYTVDNIAVTTSPVADNVLYVVAVRAYTGELEKALLSEDQGATWDIVLAWHKDLIDPLEGNGMSINNIYADPVDPYVLYIASRNIWRGKRYTPGLFDFGLSAISSSDGAAADEFYLHSNVRAIDFYGAYESARGAYIATDGGIFRTTMNISPGGGYTVVTSNTKRLIIGSYNYVSADHAGEILIGSPTLAVQAIDTGTNYDVSARFLWDLTDAAKNFISEGEGGPCAISLVNENYYAYSLFLNGALTLRRSIDKGESFQPKRDPNAQTVEWLTSGTSGMLPDARYVAPMLMWESFNDNSTLDTIVFKADTVRNFSSGDRIIHAPSKNFDYPIEHAVPFGFKHGDSIQLFDPIQNRMFVGMVQKIWMTREALNYSKTPIEWFQIAALDNTRDTSAVFAISDNANTLYIGTLLGNVHRLTGLKAVYDEATAKLVPRTLVHAFTGKKIQAIAVDPTDANHVVVVLKGGGDNIYETTNGGSELATFTLIKENLPNNVYSVLFPKGAPKGTLMVGTEKGIWMRESGSTTWAANNNGLGEVPVMSLTQITTHRPGVKNVWYYDASDGKIKINYPSNNSSYQTIYAGTYGSGVFSTGEYVGIDEITPNNPKESNALTVIPNPVKDVATIELDMAKGHATIQVYSVDGRCIKEQVAKSSVNTINFKNYAPGTYIIYVIQGETVKSAKVIKQ